MPPKNRTRKLHHPPAGSLPPPNSSPATLHPTDLQILSLLSNTLSSTLTSPDLTSLIQRIKSLLYDKKFLEVFETEELLDAYGARWVPGRALGFREMFARSTAITSLLSGDDSKEGSSPKKGKSKATDEDDIASTLAELNIGHFSPGKRKIICLGGGAGSELLALAALRASVNSPTDDEEKDDRSETKTIPRLPDWECVILDLGPYGSLLFKFEAGCRTTFPTLHKNPNSFKTSFQQIDILTPPSSQSSDPLHLLVSNPSSPHPPLITLLFTLTELFLQSRSQTILLLRRMTNSSSPGTLFLVVDSANEEASSVGIGKEGRNWDLTGLLHGMLCGDLLSRSVPAEGAAEENTKAQAAWKLVEREDSRWYRLPQGLQDHYPIKLENMRYWLRLYRRE